MYMEKGSVLFIVQGNEAFSFIKLHQLFFDTSAIYIIIYDDLVGIHVML